MAIQNRRGAYADYDATKAVAGELLVVQSDDPNTTDGKAAYIAFNSGSAKRLATAEDIDTEITSAVNEVTSAIIPVSVKQAIHTLFSSGAYLSTGLADELAIIESWASEITSISLNQTTATISGSNTVQLTATTVPAGGTVSWSSSNTSVATVSGTGLITSIGNGSATITATCGGKSATCAVTVSGFANLVSISAVYTQSGTVYNTDTLNSLKTDLVVTATYDDSTTATISGSDYVLSGTLTVGTSTITVTYGECTDTFTVTVTQAAATPLYHWDLTSSLTDTESSNVATLGGDTTPVLTSGTGLVFSGANYEYALFPSVFATDRTIVLNVSAMALSDTTRNNRFLVCVANSNYNSDTGLMIKRDTGGKWNFYNRTSSSWRNPSGDWISDSDYFAGKTLKIYIDSNSCWNIYADGTLLWTSNAVTFASASLYLGSGTLTNGNVSTTCSMGMTITELTVYEGQV